MLPSASALLAGLVFATTAVADDVPWNLEQLMRERGSVQESKARFVEQRYLKLLKAPLQSEGTLHYTAPDRLEKLTVSPKAERMLIEADRLIVENVARGTRRSVALSDYPLLWGMVESIRATLKGDLATLQRIYRVELSGTRDDWRLLLIPRDKKMQAAVESIRIGGHERVIRAVEVHESKGDRSVMNIVEEKG
jgi:hypothetical protein